MAETRFCTRLGRMAWVRMGLHNDPKPAERLQISPSHDCGNVGIVQGHRGSNQRDRQLHLGAIDGISRNVPRRRSAASPSGAEVALVSCVKRENADDYPSAVS